MHVLLHSVLPTLQQATTDPHLPWRLLDTYGEVWDSLLWGHCSFLLGPGAQGSVCALQEPISQFCVSSGSSMVGSMATSSKRAYAIPKYAALRAPAPASVHCWPTGDVQTQFCPSLCGVFGSWCTQGLFEPSESLWWVWALILNANLPLLPSCWALPLALDMGYLYKVPSAWCSHRSRAYHLAGTSLTLDVISSWLLQHCTAATKGK